MIKRIALMLALVCFLTLPARASGMEPLDEAVTGICITRLPGRDSGTITLGSRILRPGDVLTAEQAARLTFSPADPEQDAEAQVCYLPICGDTVGPEAVMTFGFRGRENKPPEAEDSDLETYKNLEITGDLKASDPEGGAITYSVTRQPRRGTVDIHEDGSFTYTPKKNKVGIDSFVYTASDAAGKTSREATVTITILKPTDAALYTDTAGKDCRFAAEWMRHTGLFTGERISGNTCFCPEKAVTQGEFLTMLVKELEIPVSKETDSTRFAEAPGWLKPYLNAALRSGLPVKDTFRTEEPIDGETAAELLCAALGIEPDSMEAMASDEAAPAVLTVSGIAIPEGTLTRADTAQILYALSALLPGNIRVQSWQ